MALVIPLGAPRVTATASSLKKTAIREGWLFLGCLGFGLLILPIAIYLVGKAIFGAYGGGDFLTFYTDIHGDIRDGELVVWFLVLSPYLIWQTLRWTFRYFKFAGRQP